jgi:hypothetical protein
METEARQTPHIFISVDEAGFNFAKTWRRGRNVIGEKSHSGCPGPEGYQHHNVSSNTLWWMAVTQTATWAVQHRASHYIPGWPLWKGWAVQHRVSHFIPGWPLWKVVPGEERVAERWIVCNCMGLCGVSPLLQSQSGTAHPRMVPLFLSPTAHPRMVPLFLSPTAHPRMVSLFLSPTAHPRMVPLFLSPYSPFLNPIEELCSSHLTLRSSTP